MARARLHRQFHAGAALLITVLIVGAVAVFITIGIALQGVDELDSALRTTRSQNAVALSEGCLQASLLRLWGDASFGAKDDATFPLSGATCSARTTQDAHDPATRALTVHTQVGAYTQNAHAVVRTQGTHLVLREEKLE